MTARLNVSFHYLSQATVGAAILVGVLVLVGWALDITLLKNVLPGLVAMKANAAIALLLMSLSLLLFERTKMSGRYRTRIARSCAVIVTLIGLLTLSQDLFGWNLHIDQLLFEESGTAVGTSSPGRMSPIASFNFLLLGIALLFLGRRSWMVQSLTLTAALAALLALAGYIYGVESLYGIATYTHMAIHSSAAFLLLSISILFAQADRGLMGIVMSDSIAGVMARRMLPAAIIVPLAVGWLRLLGQQEGLYGTEFGLAMFTVSNIIIFTILIWWNAGLLTRSDVERKQVESALRESETRFKRLVEPNILGIIVADIYGGIREANDAFLQIVGYTRDDLPIRWDEMTPPEYRCMDDEAIEQLKTTGSARS